MKQRFTSTQIPLRCNWLLLPLLLFLAACGGRAGTILPQAETTQIGLDVYGLPVPLTFAALQADPGLYQDTKIVVSGAYTPLARANCGPLPDNGPRIRWGLISDQLRLDAANLDDVLALVPQGTQVTVEGIWRLYIGPVGCGKEPARESIWYLEALQVVQPNPLPAEVAAPAATPELEGEDGEAPAGDEQSATTEEGQIIGLPEPPATGTVAVIGATATPSMPTATTDATITATLTAIASATGTTATATINPILTGTSPPGATVTNTPPPGSTPTPTPPFPTNTPAPSTTPLATGTAGPSPTPRPTNTPGSYPGATGTPGGYPGPP